MWHPDRRGDDDAATDDAFHPERTTAPHAVSVGDPAAVPMDAGDPERTRWRAEIASLGGPSPLLHFADESRTRIELSSTHPGGLPTFITGRPTLLSNLIRDELMLRQARMAAGAVVQKGVELRTVRGVDAVRLAVGVASWKHGGDEFTAPVLLRPLAIRRHGRDFELKLKGDFSVNPALVAALEDHFQISLDPAAFVELSHTGGAFTPQNAIDRLRGLTGHLPWFTVSPRLIVSTFADVASPLTAEASDLAHPVLDALAGNRSAAARLADAYRPAETTGQDARPPAVDTLLLDADEEQEEVVAQIAAGNSLVLRTLPGTGGTQTVVNALGALVGAGRRVLVVSPRRASLDALVHRLADAGLPGLAVSPTTVKRDVVQSITRAERAEQPRVGDVDDALVRLRKVLLDYRHALVRTHPDVEVSVLDALEELARLALAPEPPSTTARLDDEALTALATAREDAAAALVRAAELGQFRYGPSDSPWFGASFASTEDASAAHDRAVRLNSGDLSRLLERGRDIIGQTTLRPFETLEELGIYLRLLGDIRETLDRFQPAVFDRSLTELIAATAGRRDSGMTGANRRRLKRLAQEHVRPGVHVSDLHGALVEIQQQRTLFNRFTLTAAAPQVPLGISDALAAYQRVAEDLARLDEPLGRADGEYSLVRLRIAQLERMIGGLAAESEVLTDLQERTALLARLRRLHLDPLLDDLTARHVSAEDVAAELELAWWQSTLESILDSDRALLGANTQVLARLEADFRLVDDAHASSTGAQLAWRLAELWKIGIVDHADQAERLRRLLRSAEVDGDALVAAAPDLARVLAPVWVVSPYDVPALPDSARFDAVVLVDAGAMSVAEAAVAIRRGDQVVAVGDPVTQTPSPFRIGVEPGAPETSAGDLEALHADSVLARLAELVPVLTLTRSYRAGGEDLAELVNRRFYGGRIVSLPWAGTFLGSSSLALHFVPGGHGMPDPDTGAVESTDAEVDLVVELVAEHARARPRDSLMVVTASARHAVRVQQAVLTASVDDPALSSFLVAPGAEPFAVVTLEQSAAQSRDRVIFTIGYGRTPHGRLLSTFGALGEPGGERLLAVGMSRARRAMDIVSCFRPQDIEGDRLRHGMTALAQVLEEVESLDTPAPASADPEPLLVDLADRLERRGLSVVLGYRGELALAATHDGKAVAVDTDQVVDSSSLRTSLRLRPEVLRRLGWHYLRVHAFELFADPDAVAARIARLIGAPEQAPSAAREPGAEGGHDDIARADLADDAAGSADADTEDARTGRAGTEDAATGRAVTDDAGNDTAPIDLP